MSKAIRTAVAALLAAAGIQGGPAMAEADASQCCPVEDTPVACTITDAALMAERVETTRALLAAAQETVETETGYRFRFQRENAAELFDYARFESDCCAFIEFSITFERGRGPVWLELSGSGEAKAVIRTMLP